MQAIEAKLNYLHNIILSRHSLLSSATLVDRYVDVASKFFLGLAWAVILHTLSPLYESFV